ncbi:MAG: 5-formyltetrahydrofolate cyclo-ligase [Colwellia sp.]
MNTRSHLRKKFREKRKQFSTNQQKKASERLLQRLSVHPKIKSAQHIAVYLANDGELDPINFIHWCWQHNKDIYLPVLHPFCKGHLLFLLYNKNTTLIKNTFGLLEPKLEVTSVIPTEKLDVICTPLVAFDNTGERLGMGGGYYDRTLAAWYTNQQTHLPTTFYPIGIAHDCQQVASISKAPWDIPLPEIITPSKNFTF